MHAHINYLSVLRVLSLFFFCYGSPAERHSSQDNISAQLVKRWENSRHQKGQINCCLKSQAQHVWCRKALKMKVAYKGSDFESFLIWVYKSTQSFTVFYSSISHPACNFTVSHISVLTVPQPGFQLGKGAVSKKCSSYCKTNAPCDCFQHQTEISFWDAVTTSPPSDFWRQLSM